MSEPLFDFVKKFNQDMPRGEGLRNLQMDSLVQQIGVWISAHKEALLLAWFAQYGFEPGKAVLEQRFLPEGGWTLRIREATAEEMEEARRARERHGKADA